ncbi:radical SAM family heme chaperone HemW [Clostridium sediminicola]|uniref:radical SAM family heme chaperone HemW n=1 Tax=Clostridium sediminicola TaxID=3114879 RepID=UPI0031F25611
MSDKLSLYIHIPFCMKKCLYCDFPSYSNMESYMMDYSNALAKEIEKLDYDNFYTIFIGGGTPTYLSLEGWRIISNAIKNKIKNKFTEFTVEVNPGTADRQKLLFLKSIGVNRLSIGLQAWQNQHLKELGRIHKLEEFLELYNSAREVGFKNINIDLMYGLPNQDLGQWKETLENAVQLQPEHISCYSLIIEEGTPFYSMYENKVIELPSEEIERKMNDFTIEFLAKNNYNRYEISNYSKKGMECKHNLVYWDLENYIGCGAGAHSYIEGSRFNNTQSIKEYIEKVNSSENAHKEMLENTLENNMEEFMFLGLRKINGISIEKFNKKFKKSIYAVYGQVIDKYIESKHMLKDGDRLHLSNSGIEISNTIMSDFIL